MRLIHRAIGEAAGAGKDIAATHIKEVEQLLWKQSGRRVDLPYGITARRVYGEIVLSAGTGNAKNPEGRTVSEIDVETPRLLLQKETEIALPGARLCCRVFPFFGNIAKIPRKMYTKWFDYDKIKDNFSVRTRRPGDYFILDAAGHRKKLSDYFIDEKLPAGQRDRCLLVAQESRVLWIIGGRMSYDAGITEDTKMVLEMTYRGGEPDGLQQEK
jgi:tRNA(Ile)-lysidine synthase